VGFTVSSSIKNNSSSNSPVLFGIHNCCSKSNYCYAFVEYKNHISLICTSYQIQMKFHYSFDKNVILNIDLLHKLNSRQTKSRPPIHSGKVWLSAGNLILQPFVLFLISLLQLKQWYSYFDFPNKWAEEGDMKLTIAKQWPSTQSAVNIFAHVKLGTCWDLVNYNDQLPQKTCSWWEAMHWSLGYIYTKAYILPNNFFVFYTKITYFIEIFLHIQI